MKILQVVHSLPFFNQAGTEIYTYDLSLELSKRHEVFIFSRISDAGQKDYRIKEERFGKIRAYLINNTFRDCGSFERYYENEAIDAQFARVLDEVKPDIIHIQHLVFLSIGLIRKIKERNIPAVFTLHDYWLMCPKWHLFRKDNKPCTQAVFDGPSRECVSCLEEMLSMNKNAMRLYMFNRRWLPGFILKEFKKAYFLYGRRVSNVSSAADKLRDRNLRVKYCLNKIDIFLAPSKYIRDSFIKFGVPAGKIRLSRYGFGSRLFINIQKSKADKIRFAFIGTILPAKGLDILIQSFNKINSRGAQLMIYGELFSYAGFDGYPSYLRRITKNKNIRFMGGFKHSEIGSVFKGIDMLIVPSLWHENSPLVIHEAFLSKTPVIASCLGGMPELISDGVNGLLFNPLDTNALKEKIEYIIKNPSLIAKFAGNIPQIKSVEEDGREMEEIYSGLISPRKDSLCGFAAYCA